MIDSPIEMSHYPPPMRPDIDSLFNSTTWWSAFFSWFLAQSTKLVINLLETRRVDFQYLASLGGMPSAHSALVSGLATAIGLHSGFDSDVFILSLGVAFVVMFDASTVRQAAGQQARLLNEIMDDLFKEHRVSRPKLRELLGHTATEVMVGMLLGIVIAFLVHYLTPLLPWRHG